MFSNNSLLTISIRSCGLHAHSQGLTEREMNEIDGYFQLQNSESQSFALHFGIFAALLEIIKSSQPLLAMSKDTSMWMSITITAYGFDAHTDLKPPLLSLVVFASCCFPAWSITSCIEFNSSYGFLFVRSTRITACGPHAHSATVRVFAFQCSSAALLKALKTDEVFIHPDLVLMIFPISFPTIHHIVDLSITPCPGFSILNWHWRIGADFAEQAVLAIGMSRVAPHAHSHTELGEADGLFDIDAGRLEKLRGVFIQSQNSTKILDRISSDLCHVARLSITPCLIRPRGSDSVCLITCAANQRQ